MCGIAGVLNVSGGPVHAGQIVGMCDSIRHRGPDGAYYAAGWNDEVVAFGEADRELRRRFDEGPPSWVFGHRRLAIIDLTLGGRQPMCTPDGRLWITYNGEIYNYRELRADLERQGVRFRSASDTEVILQHYAHAGRNGLADLNGIFALAIWDDRQRELVLARDRFGIKPLFYAHVNRQLLFASEIKAILAAHRLAARMNFRTLAEHLVYQNHFGRDTFFEGVELLAPGEYLVCRDGTEHVGRFWTPPVGDSDPIDEDVAAAHLRDALESAIVRQMVSDVPLGTFLSGGMDTGSISAVAARHIHPLHTFTCGFDVTGVSREEQLFDERIASADLARRLGTEHHEIVLAPGDMQAILPRVVWHLEEPRVGISYQVLYTADLISRDVAVVLSGVGGDECYAGYPWRYEAIMSCATPEEFDRTYHRLWQRLLTDEERGDLLTSEGRRACGDYHSLDSYRAVMRDCSAQDPLARALYFDARTFLHGLLQVDDRLSMACAVEARVPLLDNDVMDLVLRLPARLKFCNGESKYILKRAVRGLLPEETLNRRKQGFTPPDRSWYAGETLAYIRELLLGRQAAARGLFRPAAIERLLDEHAAGRRNHRFLIWSLMCIEWWHRLFVEGESIDNYRTIRDVSSDVMQRTSVSAAALGAEQQQCG